MATTAAGYLTGALLGIIGGTTDLTVRIGLATFLAVGGGLLGLADLLGEKVPVLQCNRETPQVWARSGGTRWAFLNGGSLGWGGLTRVGFWAWYLIPASAFLVGDALQSALIYGTYGLSRSLGGIALLAAIWFGKSRNRYAADDAALWLLSRQALARRLSAWQLIVVAVVVVFTIGL